MDAKIVAAATGQYFEPKVKLAKSAGMLSPELAESIGYLHGFRNTGHHSGQRHEGILHSLSLFYFRSACDALAGLRGFGWSSNSGDVIPHRAMKYLGRSAGGGGRSRESFQGAWKRLDEVAASMGDALIGDLHADMKKTVDANDDAIQFVADDSPKPLTRRAVVIQAQTWAIAWSEEAKAYASANMPASSPNTVGAYVDWLASTYPWPTKGDPIPSWKKRLASLQKEKNHHAALKKYCDFMVQTEELRAAIYQSASGLDAHIQQEIDETRGK